MFLLGVMLIMLLPRPAVRPRGGGGADVRFASYRALANNSVGHVQPAGIVGERLLEVDYLCSLWFGRTEWFGLLWREPPPTGLDRPKEPPPEPSSP